MEQMTLTAPPMGTKMLLPKRDYRPLKLKKSPRRGGLGGLFASHGRRPASPERERLPDPGGDA